MPREGVGARKGEGGVGGGGRIPSPVGVWVPDVLTVSTSCLHHGESGRVGINSVPRTTCGAVNPHMSCTVQVSYHI